MFITRVVWRLGDGTEIELTDADPSFDITHVYDIPGVYDVSITIQDQFGIEETVTKLQFMEIMDAPIADFDGSPLDGSITPDPDGILDPGLDVSFWDLSFGGDDWTAINWFFNFGDGESAETTTRPTEANPIVHRYLLEGFYTVTLEVTFENNTSGETQNLTCELLNFVTVRPCIGCPSTGEGEGEGEGEGGTEGEGEGEGGTEGEGEGEGGSGTAPPAVNFTATMTILDQEALVPLNDWVPLHNFLIGYPADSAAEGEVARYISRLRYIIHPDERDPDDLNYANILGPDRTDILEFALFRETWSSDEEDNGTLSSNDIQILTWDADGVESDTGQPVAEVTDLGLSIAYLLNFYGEATAGDIPDFPVLVSGPEIDGQFAGNSYILAVRTSATWRSQITMGSDVDFVEMVLASDGGVAVDSESGEPSDSFSPNFADGETLDEDVAYSASFGVWDITGNFLDVEDGSGTPQVSGWNYWYHPMYLYTPSAEHLRPTWNNLSRLLQSNAGEMLQLRSLVPMESYTPVLGINLHSTNPIHPDDTLFDRFQFENGASLKEVNLVFTDIGGDSAGPEGNGGFNPRTGLERMTEDVGISFSTAFGVDYAFNGVWIWNDTNNNGLFDAPTQGAEGTIEFVDFPMDPFDVGIDPIWEYIPEPPGGGDPWWRISLRLSGHQRTAVGTDGDDVAWIPGTRSRQY